MKNTSKRSCLLIAGVLATTLTTQAAVITVNGSAPVAVRVTNVWKNRLIGDAKLPEAERTTWTAYPFYKNEPNTPLMKSGLLGPVRLLSSETVSIDL